MMKVDFTVSVVALVAISGSSIYNIMSQWSPLDLDSSKSVIPILRATTCHLIGVIVQSCRPGRMVLIMTPKSTGCTLFGQYSPYQSLLIVPISLLSVLIARCRKIF